MIVLLVLFVFGLIAAGIASSRSRSGVGWFFIGFFFPLLSLILLMVLPPVVSLDYYVPEPEPGPLQIQQQQFAVAQTKRNQALDSLARLSDLKDRGALNEMEFEAKKSELLARI